MQSINQSAQDVTEQLVDLDVRISNARQSVANVREFMDRTENLNELVALEGELTRRQTDLERLEAQQRNLSDRVALSTITIEVVPTASVPEPVDDDADTIGDAFRTGLGRVRRLRSSAIGFVLAVALPFLAARRCRCSAARSGRRGRGGTPPTSRRRASIGRIRARQMPTTPVGRRRVATRTTLGDAETASRRA